MEESREFTGKNVEEALSSALSELNVTEDQIEYEVVEKESNGFLGLFNNKPAKIIVKLKKKDICSVATGFINEVLSAMGVKADVKASLTESNDEIDIDLEGDLIHFSIS